MRGERPGLHGDYLVFPATPRSPKVVQRLGQIISASGRLRAVQSEHGSRTALHITPIVRVQAQWHLRA